jgi:hypothetical protein
MSGFPKAAELARLTELSNNIRGQCEELKAKYGDAAVSGALRAVAVAHCGCSGCRRLVATR